MRDTFAARLAELGVDCRDTVTVQARAAEAPAPAPVAAAPGPVPTAEPRAQNEMSMIIKPSARDRWMASYVHYYTPRMVENTCRSAMAGNLLAQWLMFDLMEQTWPRLSKNLNELKDAVTDLDWNVQPYALKGQKPSDEAYRRAKVVEAMLWDMHPDEAANENDFDDTLRDVMDAVGKGVSLLEIDWELGNIQLDLSSPSKKSKPAGNNGRTQAPLTPMQVWRPRATRWVHPRYYGWPSYGLGANESQQDRMMLFAPEVAQSNPRFNAQNMWQEFPPDQFIISIFKQKSGHALSGSMMRILAFFWAALNFDWEWFINTAQIFATPLRFATYDETKKNLLPLISSMMTQLGSAGWGVFPAGTKIELHDGVTSAEHNPQVVLMEKADEIVDLLILGQTLTSTQGQRGSQALGTIHKSVRDEKIHAVGKRAGKVMQQMVRAICRRNFGNDDECPILVPADNEAKDAMANAQRDQILLATPGVKLGKDWYYDRHDVPVPQEGEDVLEAAAPAQPLGEVKPPDEETDTAIARDAATVTAQAALATERLTNHVLENLTHVEAKWLGTVRPHFRALVQAAQNGDLSDKQFVQVLAKAQRDMPDLFDKLDTKSLQDALEKSMGAAAVNGAVRGYVNRGGAR